MAAHGRHAGSPRRGRQPAGAVATPPKTPAKANPDKSPCRSGDSADGTQPETSTRSQSAGVLAVSIPFVVCEAMTRAVWSHAKSQAEISTGMTAVAFTQTNVVSASFSSQSPPGKRRRTGVCELRAFTFSTFGVSQPSSIEEEQTGSSTSYDALTQARAALDLALAEIGSDGSATADVFGRVRGMAASASSYWRVASLDLSKAASCLHRFLGHQRSLYWRHAPWRGVNLGGWLLLEPGPSAALYEQFGCNGCEWQLMQKMREALGPESAADKLRMHRETFVTEGDIQRIAQLGMNAVRIPFGYWVVTGPTHGDVFVGPCMEYLDRAVAWCSVHGLQVLLDLHGAPGGESGEKPCGRERTDWHWKNWRFDESIAALRAIAERYRGNKVITGISVCNEPSETLPADVLCRFYDRAVRTIREAGMPPDEVSIVLPVFRTERLDEIWRIWNGKFDGFMHHPNVAFDLHLYHVFGAWWQRQGLGSHLRMTKRHRKILRRVPAVVGEWSLALPAHARGDAEEEADVMRAFAAAQLEAYGQASHGWFFWNWRDCPRQHAGWDAQVCFERRWLALFNTPTSAAC